MTLTPTLHARLTALDVFLFVTAPIWRPIGFLGGLVWIAYDSWRQSRCHQHVFEVRHDCRDLYGQLIGPTLVCLDCGSRVAA